MSLAEQQRGRVGLVVPAAGQGARMGGGGTKKQFLELDGETILVRALGHFQRFPAIDTIAVAVPADSVGPATELIARAGLSKVSAVVAGGDQRQESVWNGLEALKASDLGHVLVHDAVRPFVSAELIGRVLDAAVRYGAAVPAVRPKETVKLSSAGHRIETLPRDRLWLAQTPQGFRFELLRAAYERARAERFTGTDDASLVERMGEGVHLVEGDYDNIKITTAEDLELASAILSLLRRGSGRQTAARDPGGQRGRTKRV